MRAALAILVLLCRVAVADTPEESGPKSPRMATVLSVSATAAGYAALGITYAVAGRSRSGLVAYTFGGTLALVGPSLGRAYAENYTASGGFLLRLAALPTTVIAGLVVAAECEDLEPCPGHPIGTGMLVGAGAMIVAGTIWELVTVGDQARRYNRRWRSAPVTLVPTRHGLALAGSF